MMLLKCDIGLAIRRCKGQVDRSGHFRGLLSHLKHVVLPSIHTLFPRQRQPLEGAALVWIAVKSLVYWRIGFSHRLTKGRQRDNLFSFLPGNMRFQGGLEA